MKPPSKVHNYVVLMELSSGSSKYGEYVNFQKILRL